MAVKTTDRAMDISRAIPLTWYHRTDPNSLLMFTEQELMGYLKFGKSEKQGPDRRPVKEKEKS